MQAYLCIPIFSDSGAPENVTLEVIGPSNVRVSWEPPSPPNGITTTYIVTWKYENIQKGDVHLTKFNDYTISGLRPNEPIYAFVCTLNEDKYTACSDEVRTATSSGEECEFLCSICQNLNYCLKVFFFTALFVVASVIKSTAGGM